MYKVIIFDLDGTLTDSAKGILNCVKHALKQMNREEMSRAELMKFIGPPLYDSFQQFCGMSVAESERAVGLYRERYGDVGLFENEVYDGVREMLIKLKAADKILAVSTSKPEVYARRILDYFKLDTYFDYIGGAGMGTRNEKSAVISYTLDCLKVTDRRQVLMIGDRMHDILGAHKVGIDCMAVLYGYGSREEFEEYGADFIAETPDDVANMIVDIR